MKMDREAKVTRPVIPSLTAAIREANHWLENNGYKVLRDSMGDSWHLELHFELADKSLKQSSEWRLQINAVCYLTKDSLIRSGVFEKGKDDRILSLIPSKREIKINLKPIEYYAHGEKEGRELLVELIPKIKNQLLHTHIRQIKRELIGQWIDKNRRFGGEKSWENTDG